MADTESALARAQAGRRKSATEKREAFKQGRGKYSKWILLGLGLLIPLLFWWKSEGTETVTKVKETFAAPSASQRDAAPIVQTIQVFPERRNQDGEVIPGVRSNTMYTLTTVSSKAKLLELRKGFCLYPSTGTPGMPGVEVMVMGEDQRKGWVQFQEWYNKLQDDDPTIPFKTVKWMSLRATDQSVTVSYEYKYDTTAKCSFKF